jgi:PhzF family phenazine biosynthesis protein
MPLPLLTVDAFTDRPFAGNPAAVCLLAEERDAVWMQNVARDMNLSETAFVVTRPDGDFGLRWFTPAVEVDLCGHATLASAHALWEIGRLERSRTARFHTKSGLLTAARDGEWIELDFPAYPTREAGEVAGLAEALGAKPTWVGRVRRDVLAEFASEEAVRALAPDFAKLRAVDTRAVIATSRATTAPYDFVSRFFATNVGIDEDPVTGSAHCALTPFWSERLGKRVMNAHQASARGGVLRVRLEGERVAIAGRAVTITRGELLV